MTEWIKRNPDGKWPYEFSLGKGPYLLLLQRSGNYDLEVWRDPPNPAQLAMWVGYKPFIAAIYDADLGEPEIKEFKTS